MNNSIPAPPPPPPPPPAEIPSIPMPREISYIAETGDITSIIKTQFANCGEVNEFHRSTRAGDLRRLDALAARDPDIINSKGLERNAYIYYIFVYKDNSQISKNLNCSPKSLVY